jgi:hypothetical protein
MAQQSEDFVPDISTQPAASKVAPPLPLHDVGAEANQAALTKMQPSFMSTLPGDASRLAGNMWSAVKGAAAPFNPSIQPGETPLTAIPAARIGKSVYDLGKQALQIPAAIRDINASPDPLTHYANALTDMAGQGAGAALTGALTEGASRAIPAAIDNAGTAGTFIKGAAMETPILKGPIKGGLRAVAKEQALARAADESAATAAEQARLDARPEMQKLGVKDPAVLRPQDQAAGKVGADVPQNRDMGASTITTEPDQSITHSDYNAGGEARSFNVKPGEPLHGLMDRIAKMPPGGYSPEEVATWPEPGRSIAQAAARNPARQAYAEPPAAASTPSERIANLPRRGDMKTPEQLGLKPLADRSYDVPGVGDVNGGDLVQMPGTNRGLARYRTTVTPAELASVEDVGGGRTGDTLQRPGQSAASSEEVNDLAQDFINKQPPAPDDIKAEKPPLQTSFLTQLKNTEPRSMEGEGIVGKWKNADIVAKAKELGIDYDPNQIGPGSVREKMGGTSTHQTGRMLLVRHIVNALSEEELENLMRNDDKDK